MIFIPIFFPRNYVSYCSRSCNSINTPKIFSVTSICCAYLSGYVDGICFSTEIAEKSYTDVRSSLYGTYKYRSVQYTCRKKKNIKIYFRRIESSEESGESIHKGGSGSKQSCVFSCARSAN